jgi:hypothetical protein
MFRLKEKNEYYKKWLIRAPLGLVIIGFGACLIAEAAIYKSSGASTWQWLAYGTIALIVFNSGLSIFGDAILQRMRYEQREL